MKTMFTQKVKRVLILVVMEDALARVCSTVRKVHESRVLILVVMEDALALPNQGSNWRKQDCLNPCCNGRCTRTSVMGLSALQGIES